MVFITKFLRKLTDRDGKMDELIPKDLKVEVTPKPGTAPPMSLISPIHTEFESRNIL